MPPKRLAPGRGLTRDEDAPLAVERKRYLMHLRIEGRSKRQIRSAANMLVHIILFLGLSELLPFTTEAIRDESKRWAFDPVAHPEGPPASHRTSLFFNTAVNWLRFHEMLLAPKLVSPHFEAASRDFIESLKHRGGMSEATITTHGLRTTQFFHWLAPQKAALSLINLSDVERYLEYKRSEGRKPRSIAAACQSLRTFFRYSTFESWDGASIASGIQSPAVPRYDPGPNGPRWSEVRRLIASQSPLNRADVRAKALLLLLAVFGLRSSEVSNLLLTDFDWVDESFLVRRAKRGRVQRLPLAYEVGEAIIKYLREVRPACSCRHLFVTLNPPYRKMHMGSIGTIVDTRMRRVNLETLHHGPHTLRHSCATQLLHKGSSLKEIADFLGHRDTSSVCIYAKSSAASIRKVGAFSLDGLK